MAENLQIIFDQRDDVDRILDETPGREWLRLMFAERRAVVEMDVEELLLSYQSYLSENESVAGDIWARWDLGSQHSGIYANPITGSTIVFLGGGEEQHYPRKTPLQEEIEKLRAENSTLHKKVLHLQDEVLSYFDIVQFAAIAVFFVCALSIPVWLAYGVHLLSPLFSIAGIMGSSTFWLMAWFGKREFVNGKGLKKTSVASKPEDLNQ